MLGTIVHPSQPWLPAPRIQMPGTGSCWSIACHPDGTIYATQGCSIFMLSENDDVELWAGACRGDRQGQRLKAEFSEPHGLCWPNSERLYFCDRENHKIKYIENDEVVHYAGTGDDGRFDGPAFEARFSRPYALTELNGSLYVTDWSDTIRIISPDGMVSTIGSGTLASIDGTFSSAAFHFPTGICTGIDNTILVAESTGCSIRAIHLDLERVTTVVGYKTEAYIDGPVSEAKFALCRGIKHLPNGDIYLCDRGNDMIRVISNGTVSSLLRPNELSDKNIIIPAPNVQPYTTIAPSALCFRPDGSLWWCETSGFICYLNDVIPPFGDDAYVVQDQLSHFEDLIQHTDLFPMDVTIAPLEKGAGSSFAELQLHSYILQLNPDIDLSKLRSGLSKSAIASEPETIESLRRLFYGSFSDMAFFKQKFTSIEQATQYFRRMLKLLELLIDVEVTNLQIWVEHQIERVLSRHFADTPTIALDIFALLHREHPIFSIGQRLIACTIKPKPSSSSVVSVPDPLEPKDASNDPKTTISPKKQVLNPLEILHQRLEEWAQTISASPHLPSGSHPSSSTVVTDFVISASTEAREPTKANKKQTPLEISVPGWLIFCRWPYFERMMQSQLGETQQKRLELPTEFPSTLLVHLLRYLASGHIDLADMTLEDCRYVLSNGAEFGLVDLERYPTPSFRKFTAGCTRKVIPPITAQNCLEVLNLMRDYGNPEQLRNAETFSQNLGSWNG